MKSAIFGSTTVGLKVEFEQSWVAIITSGTGTGDDIYGLVHSKEPIRVPARQTRLAIARYGAQVDGRPSWVEVGKVVEFGDAVDGDDGDAVIWQLRLQVSE